MTTDSTKRLSILRRPLAWATAVSLAALTVACDRGCGPDPDATPAPDAALECGNGLVAGGETCDIAIASGPGMCPVSCDDGDPCTTDTLVGDACQARCEHADSGACAPAPTAYRMTSLALRDPHVFVNILGVCADATDWPLNRAIRSLLEGDDDEDGFLDLSLVTVFRPFDPSAAGNDIDLDVSSACTAPVDDTICSPSLSEAPVMTVADHVTEGVCLEPLPDTTGSYQPAVTAPGAPCYVTQAAPLVLDLAGIPVPLRAMQIAATHDAGVATGVLRGFISELDASEALLPPGLPEIGGQPLSSVLGGGEGSCSGEDQDDRDLGPSGERGWWFYFDFTAQRVSWTEE